MALINQNYSMPNTQIKEYLKEIYKAKDSNIYQDNNKYRFAKTGLSPGGNFNE
jgi:hypothetical protein